MRIYEVRNHNINLVGRPGGVGVGVGHWVRTLLGYI